ncbi:MAG: TlpA disulfide reductase family protein [Candidatus Bathyarchaeota archaeon]
MLVLAVAIVVAFGSVSTYFLFQSFSSSTDEDFLQIGRSETAVLGEQAPNFRLIDLDGNVFALSDFRDNIVVLDTMATWCVECRFEMEHLRQIHSKYSDEGVVLISVDIDPIETNEELRQFKEEFEAQWIFALDILRLEGRESRPSSVALNYQPTPLPTVYIIDQNGKLVFRSSGLTSSETISQVIENLA